MLIYENILREFSRQKVKFVLVGGLAYNLLGGFRGTADLDILVEMTDANLAQLVKILKKKGYRVKQPIDPMGIADKEIRRDWISNKNMKAFCFYKDGGEQVDIIIDSPVTYAQAWETAENVRVDDIVIPVISLDNLIKMKKNTGREQDQLDVNELSKLKKLRRELQ